MSFMKKIEIFMFVIVAFMGTATLYNISNGVSYV
jgi:hypothetical protein